MKFSAEGAMRCPDGYSLAALQNAMRARELLCGRALMFDENKALRLNLGAALGIMPHEECAWGVREGCVRDVALITRVGRTVCFTVQALDETKQPPVATLSRAQAQQMCKAEYLDLLASGDVLRARVTRLEPFGAFCDVGCGISALMPIDCMSVSRIQSPADRVACGQDIECLVKMRDEAGRLVLTMKELLGTWQENAARFAAGQTVVGVVRSVESYGVFIELAPNLAGLAEPDSTLAPGQLVSVYIKSICPQRMKVKLAVTQVLEETGSACRCAVFSKAATWIHGAIPPRKARSIWKLCLPEHGCLLFLSPARPILYKRAGLGYNKGKRERPCTAAGCAHRGI